jgi:beta-N-acetylhexosaminidase
LPAARIFGEWYENDPSAALEGCMLHATLLASQLRDVGATLLLGPVLDLGLEETHAVIGDRAFSAIPATVAELGGAYLRGVAQGGCWGCIKHAPGHGRALADSHFELPVVDAGLDVLEQDFTPFKALAPEADFMMTAHIAFRQLDEGLPATYSPRLLNMMQEGWGFKGLVIADDIGMQALGGSYVGRVEKALDAGCDFVICALSMLRHGMAGTVYDAGNFAGLENAVLPPLAIRGRAFLKELHLPPPMDAEILDESRTRFIKLWGDGPARMGYALSL